MNYNQPVLLSLLPVISLLGQANDSNAGRPTLEEIRVQGSQLGELDLSRATILKGDTLESRQVNSLQDLSDFSP